MRHTGNLFLCCWSPLACVRLFYLSACMFSFHILCVRFRDTTHSMYIRGLFYKPFLLHLRSLSRSLSLSPSRSTSLYSPLSLYLTLSLSLLLSTSLFPFSVLSLLRGPSAPGVLGQYPRTARVGSANRDETL